jgi:hypothetical protein
MTISIQDDLAAIKAALDAGPAWAVRDCNPKAEQWEFIADYRDAAYEHIKDAACTPERAVMSRTWLVKPLVQIDPDRIARIVEHVERIEKRNAFLFSALVEMEDSADLAVTNHGRALKRAEQLEKALREYGWHTADCPRYPTYAKLTGVPACDCGYDAALEGKE